MGTVKLEANLWGMNNFGDAEDLDDGTFDAPLLADGTLDLAALLPRAEAAVMLSRHTGRQPAPYRLIVGTIPDRGEPSLPIAIMRFSGPTRAREWEFCDRARAKFGATLAVAA
jgi:hypothetical protein